MTIAVVTNNAERRRYEIHTDGALAGFAEYNLTRDSVMFTHTEVASEHEGKGYGGMLAREALDDVRRQAKHAIPVCPFIAAFIRKHAEYQELVRPEFRTAFKL